MACSVRYWPCFHLWYNELGHGRCWKSLCRNLYPGKNRRRRHRYILENPRRLFIPPRYIFSGFFLEQVRLNWRLVHTGSRGLGASILAGETASESNPYIPPDSPHLADYLREHDYAVKWAVANRDLVAYRIKQCLYPLPPGDTTSIELEGLEKIIDVTHNSVTKYVLHIGSEESSLWVHRKGAAPADQGATPCPGSRGDYTWILQPTGDGQINGEKSKRFALFPS